MNILANKLWTSRAIFFENKSKHIRINLKNQKLYERFQVVATTSDVLMYGKIYVSFYLEARISSILLFKYLLFSLNGMREKML